MKTIIASLIVVLSISAEASTKVICRSEKTVQAGFSNIATDGEISFEIERRENQSVIHNVLGHIFVKSPYEQSAVFNTENSYMAFFKTDKLIANESYNPRKYIGFAQFNNFDAAHTTGLEDGMFGYMAIDVTPNKKEFAAFYVFQAGDHMGGTALFSCSVH